MSFSTWVMNDEHAMVKEKANMQLIKLSLIGDELPPFQIKEWQLKNPGPYPGEAQILTFNLMTNIPQLDLSMKKSK